MFVGGSSAPSGVCDRGYFCPNGSRLPTEVACTNGTYNDLYGRKSADECKNCTLGKRIMVLKEAPYSW